MEPRESPPRHNDELDRRYVRQRRVGLALSVLLHILAFVVFSHTGVPPAPSAAAGPRSGDDAAAPGGGMRLVAALPEQPNERIVRPPAPIPTPAVTFEEPEESRPAIEHVEFDDAPAVTIGDDGPERGPGRDRGEGEGAGGDAAEGRTQIVPPVPRGMIMPPGDRPDELRGREVEVWVWVTREGDVDPDSTRLVPPTGDRGFDERLREQAAQWVFEPAARRGEAVAGWFRYVITL